MKITQIEAAGRKRRIYLNDEPVFCMSGTSLDEYGLAVDEELSEETYRLICEQVLLPEAKLCALDYLKIRERTRMQLFQRLKRGEYPPEVIEEAIAYVCSYRYLDDERYARQYTEQNRHRYGNGLIRSRLFRDGVGQDVIDRVLEDFKEEDTSEAIRHWMEKRHYDPAGADERARQKQIRFLLSKGFALGDILDALNGKDN